MIHQDNYYLITFSPCRWYCFGYGLLSQKQNYKTLPSKELGDVTTEENIRTRKYHVQSANVFTCYFTI